MAKHIWTVVCESAAADGADGVLSIWRILEELSAQIMIPHGQPLPDKTPPIPLTITIVSLWERSTPDVEEKDEPFRVRVVDPAGKELFRRDQNMTLAGPHLRMRAMQKIAGLPLSEPGRYEIQILGKHGNRWAKVAAIPVQVKISVVEGPPQGRKPS